MSGGYDGRDAARSLIAALAAMALTAQITLTIAETQERPWASATFNGARHVVSVELDGDGVAIDRWLAALPEAQFAMRHHIVADIAVAARSGYGAVIEALTVAND